MPTELVMDNIETFIAVAIAIISTFYAVHTSKKTDRLHTAVAGIAGAYDIYQRNRIGREENDLRNFCEKLLANEIQVSVSLVQDLIDEERVERERRTRRYDRKSGVVYRDSP